ncbi:hypothetical protein [Candidatus Palauibacter soopunensis]|uniref:hypothetical protein n=1 Tax=Candidatus Palauibacter soopunensis TaxID=3056739 RepID=UPI0023A27B2D|nr:hypothetical protein [Candidatus Palauibacter soopunensis]MDE2878856.1 hypothetical protein [Candidatus Palauibacter soopunensis]
MRFFRKDVQGLSLRDFRSRVNAELSEHARVSLGTLSNYEREAGGSSRAGPRAEFLAALKRAFPRLRLEWLILGDGEPTTIAERLAAPEGLETKAGSPADGERSFATRVLARYPDLELLSPEASALFMAALTRLAMGEPKLALDEGDLIELAGDLRWLLLLPPGAWGFRHAPPYRAFSDYAVAMLHALSQLMPESGDGDPIGDHSTSILPQLRRFRTVGF